MIDKLPKELLAKLSDEEQATLKSMFDTEARKIRESSERDKVSKKEYEILQSELNSLKKGNEVDTLLRDVPSKLQKLFRKELLNADDPKATFETLKDENKDLIASLVEPEGTIGDGAIAESLKVEKIDPAKVKEQQDAERIANGLPVL